MHILHNGDNKNGLLQQVMWHFKKQQMTRFLLIIIFSVLTGLSSVGQSSSKKKNIVYTVDFDYLEGCETGKGDCNPVIIERQSIPDSITLIFPNGGTLTDVYLYTESSFTKWMSGKPQDEPKPLRHDHKEVSQGKPFLDLTGLPDGKYRPRMLGSGLGGGFKLTIVTKAKIKNAT